MAKYYAKRRFWICVFCVLLCAQCTVAHAQVVINEVMFNPAQSEFFDEFIELYNVGDTSVDLMGWRVGDGDDTDAIRDTGQGVVLQPKMYALILDADYFGRSTVYEPLPSEALILTVEGSTFGNGGLHNSENEQVVLISADGDTVSAVTYQTPNESGISEEKIASDGGDLPANWGDAKWEGGTPGQANSLSVKTVDLVLRPSVESPSHVAWGQDATVTVWAVNVGREALGPFEILVAGFFETAIEVSRSLIVGDSVQVVVFQGAVPGGVQELEIVGGVDGDEDLSNQTVRWHAYGGYPPGQVVINEIMAAPTTGEEWVELFNVGKNTVDLRGWVLKDTRTSVKIKRGKSPGQGLLVLAHNSDEVDFSDSNRLPTLNNGGDSLELLDATGGVIDRVVYPEATADVSLERIDAFAPGTDLANWLNSTVGATPGLPNSVKAVHVDTVRLVADPNPFDGETHIRYQLPVSRAHVNLWVFDREGRKIRTLLDVSEAGAAREIVWDGRGDGQEFLKPGVFVLYLEARSPDGQVFQAKTPVAYVKGISN